MVKDWLSLFREDLEHVFAHTRDFWKEVRGQRLFITGGTGFFGIWLVESFLWANEQLELEAQAVVLSRDPRAFCRKMPHWATHPALSFHVGDVRTFEFPVGNFSHVIHAAAERINSASDVDRFAVFERDIQGTRRTLDMARHCNAVGFLLTSSGAVYGRQPPELSHTPEDYRGAPDTMNIDASYGHAKRVSELLCAMSFQQYGLETKIARCFAFVGPHLPLEANFAVGNFIRDGGYFAGNSG
jgi:nucleoside-diphosphate-sugar epimerase